MKRLQQLLLITFWLTIGHTLCWGQIASDEKDDNNGHWYQVEVFIFANDDPSAAQGERWPDDLDLRYPTTIVQLQEQQTDTTVDEQLPVSAEQPQATITDHSVETTQPGDATLPQQTPTEQAFRVLPNSEWRLQTAANRILRQHNYRLLFHKAWRQPVFGRDKSESILIRGGNQYDDHYELEGSINLSVERYLHIKTDLWLSTFKSAAELELNLWPRLPKPPVVSLTQNYSELQSWQNSSLASTGFGYHSPFADLQRRQYTADRIVTLRQSRRMRSNELHYIDHPLMGLLVKVTPYEPKIATSQPKSSL